MLPSSNPRLLLLASLFSLSALNASAAPHRDTSLALRQLENVDDAIPDESPLDNLADILDDVNDDGDDRDDFPASCRDICSPFANALRSCQAENSDDVARRNCMCGADNRSLIDSCVNCLVAEPETRHWKADDKRDAEEKRREFYNTCPADNGSNSTGAAASAGLGNIDDAIPDDSPLDDLADILDDADDDNNDDDFPAECHETCTPFANVLRSCQSDNSSHSARRSCMCSAGNRSLVDQCVQCLMSTTETGDWDAEDKRDVQQKQRAFYNTCPADSTAGSNASSTSTSTGEAASGTTGSGSVQTNEESAAPGQRFTSTGFALAAGVVALGSVLV